MKKLLLVTALSAFTILSATSAFAQEVPATTKASGKSVQTNGKGERVAFSNKEELKEIHYQMIDSMMKDIIEAPRANKRVKRGVLRDTGEQQYTGRIGQRFTNDAQYHINLLNKLHLVTDYKIYSRHAEITSTSTVGTKSGAPYSISQQSSILENNERTVSSRAEFVSTANLGIEWSSKTYNITTTITVKYANDGVITFTARSIVRD
ncbi:hypothetical protein [Paenibacillus popilliae]|uniref:Glycine/serine hydroxymethyltransferase n=1 Tax=Paenibacillus popilliae ATCC 14706 TaxID=1212764 RepID=M9LA27_PAEPP|nr:hypothetical protein [Paenibacillus popilliae]BAQ95617.1 hypothetical protein [Paenibacillus popilliae ATCC 14706]GAC42417.1 glycine/serine hydroxymethyltransferase [Paenibacillus popilliae ATCC 14706]